MSDWRGRDEGIYGEGNIYEVILVHHENMGEYDKIVGLVKEINQKGVLLEIWGKMQDACSTLP